MHRILKASLVMVALALASATSSRADEEATKEEQEARSPDCVYVATPFDVVERMLELADVTKDDLVYDPGCGDGRIVVTAAKKYGCRGIGFDINPVRVEEALENARQNRTDALVKIEERDIFTLDFSPCNVVALYLLPSMNKKLIPQFQELKPGSRIVSHDYRIEGMKADKVVHMVSMEDGADHTIYLWTAPLKRKKQES